MSKHRVKKHRHRHHRKHDWRDWVRKHSVGIGIAVGAIVGVVVLVFGASVGWQAYQASLYGGEYGSELESALGFTTDTVSVQAGGVNVPVFIIEPVPNGYMDKIGFRDGDIIKSLSFTEFYKMLHTQRGHVVSVDVVDGGDGAPMEARKVKTVRFLVPQGN